MLEALPATPLQTVTRPQRGGTIAPWVYVRYDRALVEHDQEGIV
jgi:hypothetical protein